MKICVVGGAGFLGSHVADQLTAYGHDVTIFDKFPSQWGSDNQRILVGDLNSFSEVKNAVKGSEVVYNFAAIADLDDASVKPVETAIVNVVGNTHVLEACRQTGVSRFVYASTVYVNSREGGFYRCSKQAAENYIEEYKNAYGLDYTILRYGSLYGPRAPANNGIRRIVEAGLKTGKLTYTGSPETIREYIHVEDAARASVEILEKKYRNQSVILTGNEQMRVLDILETLSEILNMSDSVKIISGVQSGHYVRTPYAYKPNLSLKYNPSLYVDLGQGLLQVVEEVQKSIKKG